MATLISTPPLERLAPIDEPPDNFDAAINPILGKHWYGLPRKRTYGHRSLGPGERAAISALRRQRHIQKLHGLGPRALDELLIEIGAERGITTIIDQKLKRYAELDPEALEMAGGDEFPPVPLHEVRRAP